MQTITDIQTALTQMPLWAWMGLGLTLFGLWWKKTSWMPNRYLPWFNIALPTVLYPALCDQSKWGQEYYHGLLLSVLFGVIIGMVVELFHEGIIAKIKKSTPWIEWPEDPPKT